MDNGNLLFVLRCGQCNKPFDKEASLKRHGYYCRSRKSGSTSRIRSCVTCSREKVRCDHQRPACSRCKHRQKECHYPNKQTTGSSFIAEHQTHLGSLNPTSPTLLAAHVDLSPADVLVTTSSESMLDASFVEPDQAIEQAQAWSNLNLGFNEFIPLSQHHISPVRSTIRVDPGNVSEPERPVEVASSPPYAILSMSTRSLVERQSTKVVSKRASILLRSTLRSYPLMIRQGNHIPPFIHPALLQSGDATKDMEALHNCISLLYMLNSGLQSSRNLFWRNVRLECEHICQTVMDLNRWELLAAIQALAVYLIIRVSEGETECNNLDSLLQTTVMMVCAQFNLHMDMSHPNSFSTGIDTKWKEWLFKESKRRVCVIYKVINLLVHFEPATLCGHPSDILIAPLPARRYFWEADSALSWNQENAKHIGVEHDFALTRHGDLIKVDSGKSLCESGSNYQQLLDFDPNPGVSEDWGEWCSGMDGFGGLVMLAASMCDQ